jgi:hypothetical protein
MHISALNRIVKCNSVIAHAFAGCCNDNISHPTSWLKVTVRRFVGCSISKNNELTTKHNHSASFKINRLARKGEI